MQKNKICLIPDLKRPYNIKMVRDLAVALTSVGYKAYHHNSPVKDRELNSFVLENGFDTILRINRLPPKTEKRANNFRHLSWFQDVYPSLSFDEESFEPNDLVFTLGTREVLGFPVSDKYYGGPLNLYIDPKEFENFKVKKEGHPYDFNLVGFIPNIPFIDFLDISAKDTKKPNLFAKRLRLQMAYLRRLIEILIRAEFDKFNWEKIQNVMRTIYLSDLNEINALVKYNKLKMERDKELGNLPFIRMKDREKIDGLDKEMGGLVQPAMAQFAEENYPVLEGVLDIHKFFSLFKQNFGGDICEKEAEFIDFCIRELPRFLDRYELIKHVSKLSEAIILCGENWDMYDISRDFHVGPITNEQSYLIFNSSKITLQNNNHGIGIHSRTLSAMASGGFVLNHNSLRDTLPGGMRSKFEPGSHYGDYTIETLEDECQRWLNSDDERNRVAKNARKLVLAEMTWGSGAKYLGAAADL